VGIIKANTGKSLKERLDFLKQRYYGRGDIWSIGYFASTIGLNEHIIRRYLEHQGKEDSEQAKLAL